jgi:hypothetical protein
MLTLLSISGCGGSSPGNRETAAEEQSDDQATNAAAEDDSPKSKKAGKAKKSAKGSETAHIGGIPKDVWPEIWFKQPLSVVAEGGAADNPAAAPSAGDDVGAKPAVTEVASTAGTPAAPPSKSGTLDWHSLITGEVLADESKALKNKLTAQLQDKGRYDSTYKQMRVDATVLAVLAAIAPDVPDSPGWKINAKYVRDVASEVAAVSKNNGPQFYKKAKEAYDKLDSLLAGNKPPDVGDAAEHVNFSEIAERRYLMLRMERISSWMKSDINGEAVFKKEAAKLTQEASVLAIIAKVIATPDYAGHDIDEYKGYAETVRQSATGIAAAAKDGDFTAYTNLLDTCQKSCNKCHEEFK